MVPHITAHDVAKFIQIFRFSKVAVVPITSMNVFFNSMQVESKAIKELRL